MNNYGIFFTLGSKVIRLPVNPEELPDSLAGLNETYDILGIGEVTAIRTPAQREIEISGLFPARVDTFVVTPNQFMKPEEYIKFFRDAMYNKDTLIYTPVRYMDDGTPFASEDIGFTCTVESFEVKESGAETGDFYYTLLIKEYRDYTPQQVKVAPGSVTAKKTATKTKTRSVPKDEPVVGAKGTASGKAYSQPISKADPLPSSVYAFSLQTNTPVQITRIVTRADGCKDYHIVNSQGDYLGWITEDPVSIKTPTSDEHLAGYSPSLWASTEDNRSFMTYYNGSWIVPI